MSTRNFIPIVAFCLIAALILPFVLFGSRTGMTVLGVAAGCWIVVVAGAVLLDEWASRREAAKRRAERVMLTFTVAAPAITFDQPGIGRA